MVQLFGRLILGKNVGVSFIMGRMVGEGDIEGGEAKFRSGVVVAVLLCVVGVTFFTVSYGAFPWIAISLAVSFGLYGAVKKKADYPATLSLAFENVVLLVPAIALAVGVACVTGSHAFADFGADRGVLNTVLLVVAGPVTAIPLILFSKATISIPLSLLGFIQYLSPTIALLTGVFLFGEPFTLAHGVCFGCIWAGLALVSFETLKRNE